MTTTVDNSAEAPAPHGDYALKTGLFLVAMVAVTLYLVFSSARSSPGGLFEDCCAILLIWVTAVPTWQFIVSRRRTTPFFAAVSALYGVYFGVPRFNDRPLFGVEKWEPPAESVAPALAVALLGVTALTVAYQLGGPLVRRVPRMTRALDLRRALPLFLGATSISVALRLATARVEIPMSVQQPLVVVQAVGEMCMAGMLLAYLRGQLPRSQQFFLIAVIGVQVASGVLTGVLANALWPVFALFFVYAWEKRRLPAGAILAMAIVFVPINAAKHEFRERYGVNTSDVAAETVLARANGFVSAIEHTAENMTVREMLDVTGGRLGLLATLAVVVYQTPSRVPYWDGYSYQDIPWHFIPRFLVPSKPAISFGQEFPRRYGLIDYENVDTAFNFPQLVECYANFGIAGVVAGMALFGIIYRLMDHSLAASSGGILIAAVLYSHLLNIETDFADVFGGLPLLILVLYAFLRILPGDASAHPEGAVQDTAALSLPVRDLDA